VGWGGGGGVVAYEILVSAQGPLVFGFLGFGAKGLGPGLDNIDNNNNLIIIMMYTFENDNDCI